MDDFIKTVLTSIPNMAGLLLMLFWQQRRIDQLLAAQQKLVDEIIGLREVVKANGYLSSLHPDPPTGL